MRNSIETEVPSCVNGGQRKKGFSARFSLRRLLYSSPILGQRRQRRNSSGSSKSHKPQGKDVTDSKPGNSSKEADKGISRSIAHRVEIHQATSRTSVFANTSLSTEGVPPNLECPLCLSILPIEEFFEISSCGHKACLSCLHQYLKVQITESRVCISCPECTEFLHPNEIQTIVNDENLFTKYEDFMVRRVLAVDPDTRWCPAPDCTYAVIASECASCPKIKCERPGCNSYFCYHCKAEWHPNQTCDAARAQRSPNIRSSSVTYSQDSQYRDEIKPCPRCQVLIVKMDDGSCNHMMCAVCGAEFCWLCMKEISDLHYLSPSGCTFWGKKPWSRKKKILWQLGTLVGAPVGIALVAGITVPAMIIGIPVWVGRKLYARYKNDNKHKRNAAIVGGVVASVLISPVLAGLAVGIGVPILLFYVYGVVPVSLCRSGGCGGSAAAEDSDVTSPRNIDNSSIMDAASTRAGNPSIGEASLASGSQLLREVDRESASTMALAGSVGMPGHKLEVQADMASAQRFSISSLSDKSLNASLVDAILNYKTTGSDSCSCITTGEDCSSERVKLDDNSSFMASLIAEANSAEKTSIGSSCSFRARCFKTPLSRGDKISDSFSNDSIYIDMGTSSSEEKPRRLAATAATLRSQFFHSTLSDNKTKSLDDKVIIEVSDETLDKSLTSLSVPMQAVNKTLVKSAEALVESSKL